MPETRSSSLTLQQVDAMFIRNSPQITAMRQLVRRGSGELFASTFAEIIPEEQLPPAQESAELLLAALLLFRKHMLALNTLPQVWEETFNCDDPPYFRRLKVSVGDFVLMEHLLSPQDSCEWHGHTLGGAIEKVDGEYNVDIGWPIEKKDSHSLEKSKVILSNGEVVNWEELKANSLRMDQKRFTCGSGNISVLPGSLSVHAITKVPADSSPSLEKHVSFMVGQSLTPKLARENRGFLSQSSSREPDWATKLRCRLNEYCSSTVPSILCGEDAEAWRRRLPV